MFDLTLVMTRWWRDDDDDDDDDGGEAKTFYLLACGLHIHVIKLRY